jgi:glycosyltransferase involved in cell wall biosynthesis
MRVLFLSNLLTSAASAEPMRPMFLDYLGGLKAEGIRTAVFPPVAAQRRARLLHRVTMLRQVLRSNLVYLRGHLYAARTFNLLRAMRRPIIYYFEEAIYTYPTGQVTPPAHGWMDVVRSRLQHTIAHSQHVVVPSRALADYSRRFSPRVTILPIAVRPSPGGRPRRSHNAEPVVGWIGQAENLVYVRAIAPALRAVHARQPFTLRIVCPETLAIEGLRIDHRPWSQASEPDDLASFDVGIVPAVDDEWCRGKFSLKTVQMMAAGLPVVVSAIGGNCEIVSDGRDGLWARSEEDWRSNLLRLLRDAGLRTRLGGAARQTVVERYSFDATFPILVDVIRRAAGRARP